MTELYEDIYDFEDLLAKPCKDRFWLYWDLWARQYVLNSSSFEPYECVYWCVLDSGYAI